MPEITIGTTSLIENLDRDYGIKEPYWGLSNLRAQRKRWGGNQSRSIIAWQASKGVGDGKEGKKGGGLGRGPFLPLPPLLFLRLPRGLPSISR